MRDEAFPPLADGVPVAIQLFGDLLVGRVVVGRGVEDDAAAEGQALGCRASAGEHLELLALVSRKDDTRGKGTRHDVPPCSRGKRRKPVAQIIMGGSDTFVQTLAANL